MPITNSEGAGLGQSKELGAARISTVNSNRLSIIFNSTSQVKRVSLSHFVGTKKPSEVTGVACAGITQKTTSRARTILRLLCSNIWASALRELLGLLLSKAFIVNPKFEVLIMVKAENTINLNLLFTLLQQKILGGFWFLALFLEYLHFSFPS